MKIACWSGPRNLSTAMMYAFAARGDCAVWDEPFYAAYLGTTGIDHPMREEVMAAEETDPKKVAARCAGPVPDGKAHWYMKHMGFQMDSFPLGWAKDCVNIHLIRHPARVVASYVAKRERPTLRDIGFAQQVEIYERFPGPVLDSFDVRMDPEVALTRLCDKIGLDFDPSMLRWPAGPKLFDGAWAPHWYDAVHRSTGFAGPEGLLPDLDGEARDLVEAAMPFYEHLREAAISTGAAKRMHCTPYPDALLPATFAYPSEYVEFSGGRDVPTRLIWSLTTDEYGHAERAWELRQHWGAEGWRLMADIDPIPFAREGDRAAFFDGNDRSGDPGVVVADLGNKNASQRLENFRAWWKLALKESGL